MLTGLEVVISVKVTIAGISSRGFHSNMCFVSQTSGRRPLPVVRLVAAESVEHAVFTM